MNKLLSLALLLLFSLSVAGQDYKDQVLMTIDGREITAGEFERVYKKNNNETINQKQTVEEYVDMFVNYKLKVIEAENLGLDTAAQFLKEFNAYKQQLAQPYLTSEELTNAYAQEAYGRMQKEVNASHIMVRLGKDAPASDTLAAWEKLLGIRERILNGEDFEVVARSTSDDPSAKTNGGNLGWFSAFRMVYPFETAAFTTQPGDVSMPVRTQFGYHIVKVHEVRDAMGSVQVAHIFFRAPVSMEETEAAVAKEKAFAIYDSLTMGADFNTMADRHSDDQSTGRKGGVLPWFGAGQMIPSFDSASFALENIGDISNPVQSDYGWHIIKLLDQKNVGSFEEEKANILSNISKGDRGKAKDIAFINQLKEEYGFEDFRDNYVKFVENLDTTIFNAEWEAVKAAHISDLVLFQLGDAEFSLGQFAEFCEKKQQKRKPMDMYVLTDILYEIFEEESIMKFEESRLEEKYPEFRYIVQEYHDGILLFDLTDKMVWTKAVEDSAGIVSFYEEHKEDYKWGPRVAMDKIFLYDSTLLVEPLLKDLQKAMKKNRYDSEKLIASYCENDSLNSCIDVLEFKYEKGDNELVDGMKWKKGTVKQSEEDGVRVINLITKVMDPSIKKLEETRGMVIADYQKYLEDQWLEELRAKYEIIINTELLSKIDNQ